MKKIAFLLTLTILIFSFLLVSCGDKYTITFDTVGGSEVEVQKVGNDGKATEPAAPTKAGYTFDGWYLGSEKWSFIGYTVTDNMTLTAKWSLNTYTVTYTGLPNGATHTNQTTYTVESDCFKDGKATLSEPTVPLGYTFNGWYDANNNKITELPLENTTVRADFTLLYKDLPKLNYTVNPDGKTITVTGVKNKNITSIEIPYIVTSIGNDAFRGCSSLTSVTIPDSVTSICNYAFQFCSSLTSVTIPDSVTSIDDYAFWGCSKLTSVTIGNGVESIGDWAFRNCSSLTSVTIGNGVKSIGYQAFEGCSSLTSVTIPGSVTSIGYEAFLGCKSLKSVTIGNGVKSIDNGAFDDCTSLTSVTIGNSVESIGSYAFEGCSSLTSITIPDSVTSIGYKAFYDCDSLTSIKYRGTEQQWENISKGNIGYDGTIIYNYTGQ